MKRFLIKTLIHFIIVLIVEILLCYGTFFIISSASYEIPKNKNIIISGDSRTKYAVNDSIFSRAINISSAGKAYLYSYMELRQFLKINHHVDKILLSFHSDVMAKPKDEWAIGSIHMLRYLPPRISLLHIDEANLFINNNRNGFISCILKLPLSSMSNIYKFISRRKLTYNDLNKNLSTSTENKVLNTSMLEYDIAHRSKNDKGTNRTKYEYSRYQRDYLLNIAELCREKNVELILFNTPIYNAGTYDNKVITTDFINSNNYLSKIKYLDFSNFVLPDYGYYDIEHLNSKGIEIFSRYLENNYETIFEN